MGFLILIMMFAAVVQYIEVKNYNRSNYKKETGYPYTKVYVPKEKGGTTEIDVVMIHEKGSL